MLHCCWASIEQCWLLIIYDDDDDALMLEMFRSATRSGGWKQHRPGVVFTCSWFRTWTRHAWSESCCFTFIKMTNGNLYLVILIHWHCFIDFEFFSVVFFCLCQWLATECILFSSRSSVCAAMIIYWKFLNMISYKSFVGISPNLRRRCSCRHRWID